MGGCVVSELWVYPVKSCRGIALEQAEIGPRGIRWDRHWMVVDTAGQFLTQRQLPAMALVRTALRDDGLALEAPGRAPITVPYDAGEERIRVRVWGDEVPARAVSTAADRWLTDVLTAPCRLVSFPDDAPRAVDAQYGRPGDETAFSDGFPLLLIGQGSLDDLNVRLREPLPMRRFRPNLVVAGAAPYAEDDWRRVRAGALELRVVKPCSRCAITTVDPERGVRDGGEPLDTLARYRRRNGRVYFGQNVIPDGPGVLRIGDAVAVLA
ncbi:MAG: MOSC N-terminal beta barrel domain-containing protein [Gammaproteobacteria bacterium]|jgi:uncharacterized protein YcbX|nr:MOSC N-terminal beta barrel domain-containing protein [Gammaproteobacteria bacterium]